MPFFLPKEMPENRFSNQLLPTAWSGDHMEQQKLVTIQVFSVITVKNSTPILKSLPADPKKGDY
jgi:hypothetical protein